MTASTYASSAACLGGAEYVPGGSLRDRIDEAERRLRGAAEQGEETGMPALGMVLRAAEKGSAKAGAHLRRIRTGGRGPSV
ncbi:hypothetical protein [Streptomyces sp. NPDC006510]|uniref:hypothetical protein n=1 Tax=Streptomyces sp. NPDC006510 TaxID=3155600 RepID=UPI0033B502A6